MANFLKKLFGGSTSESRPEFQQFAGAFGGDPTQRVASSRLAAGLEGRLTSGGSDILNTLRSEILNPSFAPTSTSEEALLSSVADLAGGRSAGRGLGTPSQEGLAQVIAPELVNLRQNRVSNLATALQGEQTGQGQDIQGLLNLIQLSLPQILGGQVSRGQSFGGIVPGIAGLKSAFK